MDAILDDRVRASDRVESLLSSLELAVKYARRLTIARSWAIWQALGDLKIKDPSQLAEFQEYSELDSGAQSVMREFEERITCAYRSYVIWESPLGWVFGIAIALASRLNPTSTLAKTEDAWPAIARETIYAYPPGHKRGLGRRQILAGR